MKLFLFLALFVTTAVASPITQPIADQIGYDSMDAAAVEALKGCSKFEDKFEHGGVILQWNGKFYFTNPITSGSDRQIGSFRIALYKGSTVVGLYHTHPEGFNSDIFSSEDVKFADEKNWTSYVGVLGSAEMRIIRYVPGKTPKSLRNHMIAEDLISEGEKVNAI